MAEPEAAPARSALADAVEALGEGFALFDDGAKLLLCNERLRTIYPALASLLTPGVDWELLLREAVSRNMLDEAAARRLRMTEERLGQDGGIEQLEFDGPAGTALIATFSATRAGGFVLTLRDVTARRRLEAGEREADMLLRKVLEACPANVLMSRVADGQVIYRSPAATDLLGPIRKHAELFADRTVHADFITALLPSGGVDSMSAICLRPDGAPFSATISARMIDYRGEEVVVSTVNDLSREVAMQAELAEQRELIFQNEKMSALGELLAGVAHELNNPLSVVVGHALMLREDTADPVILRRLDKIGGAAERCSRIVKTFLAMARQLPADLRPIDLRDTIDTAIEALRLGASGLTSTVDVTLAPDLPFVLGDSDQLAQVLTNLIANADQAIESAGVDGRIVITAQLDARAKMIEIKVTDDGPGIAKDIRSRIFDPLFTTKEVGKGTGIGLSFCHRVVTSHRGQIRLDPASRPGNTTFVVRLPATDRLAAADPRAAEIADQRSSVRVLVVDDEPEVADLIGEILERDGLLVDHAASAEAAFELLGRQDYALVLSDLNMPGVGGRGFYEKVERDHPALVGRVGFVTGDTMSPSARGFLDRARRPYLEKPIAPAELRELTRRLLTPAAKGNGR
jgi:signal transduction histidine kinase/PAS domain-containing protein